METWSLIFLLFAKITRSIMKGVVYMFKFKKRKDMSLYERAVRAEKIYKWGLPIRIIIFPVMFIIKLYKWTYNED